MFNPGADPAWSPSRAGPPPSKELPEDAAATDEAERDADLLGRDLEGEPIRVSFNELPLALFIHQVFGEELGLSHVIAPGPTRA